MSDDDLIRTLHEADDLDEIDPADVAVVPPPVPVDDGEDVVILDDAEDAYDPDETVRLDVYNGLVHCIVSNTALWSTIDVAEVKHVVDDGIAALPEVPLALEPLWQYMLAAGAPRDAAASTILLFHSRAPRWNVEMALPPELAALDDDERAHAISELRARGGTSGTAITRVPSALRAPKKDAASKRFGKKAASRTKIGVALRVAFVVVCVVAIGSRLWGNSNEPRVTRALGDLCSSAELRGRAVLCTASEDALNAPTAARARGDVVDAAFGVKVLFVDPNGEVLPF